MTKLEVQQWELNVQLVHSYALLPSEVFLLQYD